MMKPFTPKRDDGRSLKTVAIDLFKTQDYGTVIPYQKLGDELGLHPERDLPIIQQTCNAANKLLLKLYKRGVQNVRGVGYRVIEPREHMLVATTHQSKADRAMVKALRFYEGADLTRMSEAERKLHHGQQMLAAAVYASHQHLDSRIRRIEDLLRGTTTISGKS